MVILSLRSLSRVSFALVAFILGRVFLGFVEWVVWLRAVFLGLLVIVVVVVIIVGIKKLFIVFSGLYLASIALLPEGKVEVVTLHTHPVMGIGLCSTWRL